MASNLDSWARSSFEPGSRVEIHPYREKRCFTEWGAYDGETGTVLARVKDGKIKVRLDRERRDWDSPASDNEPVVPMMALRPAEV